MQPQGNSNKSENCANRSALAKRRRRCLLGKAQSTLHALGSGKYLPSKPVVMLLRLLARLGEAATSTPLATSVMPPLGGVGARDQWFLSPPVLKRITYEQHLYTTPI